MARPRALILAGYGINCDRETEFAFKMAGAEARRVHINDLIAGRERLADWQILAFPGGFSFGDDIAAGKVLAVKFQCHLEEQLDRFIADGKLVIGICNGFQAVVKLGALPRLDGGFDQQATVTFNDSGKFEDRWVYLEPNPDSPCVFTKGIEHPYLPVRHGEGKFVAPPRVLEQIQSNNQVVVRYVDESGRRAGYPHNPNGSMDNIAGICDPTGRIFGLMPHPEAYLFRTNHPRWTREEVAEEGLGVAIFRNAVGFFI